jgi:hypothetical protein
MGSPPLPADATCVLVSLVSATAGHELRMPLPAIVRAAADSACAPAGRARQSPTARHTACIL